MRPKEKLSRMNREAVRLLGKAIDTAIIYGDEINFIVNTETITNEKWPWLYQDKDNIVSEKRLGQCETLSQVIDYISNCALSEIFESSKQRKEVLENSGHNTLSFAISVKTPEGIKDFILVHTENSRFVSRNTVIFDYQIMAYLFFRENFSDSLLKSDVKDLTEEQFANALENCLEQSVPTGFIKAIFPKFKEAAIAKNIMTQADALNFIFAYTERDLFITLYEYKDMDPWDAKIAKRPSEMDCCVNIHDNLRSYDGYDNLHFYDGWFYWPCLDSDKED